MTETRIVQQEFDFTLAIMNELYNSFAAKIVGQTSLLESLLIGLLSGGHILLESVPGLAKTTAARAVAESISADFQRIQCTPDLLPSDIVGTQIYDQAKAKFVTVLGPVYANILLLDEINRASAKTQSAMLEAMEERQITIAGHIHKLPEPFLVLATQNPIDQEGTYQLPEAQMDRFMIKEILTYPTPEEEEEVIYRMERGVFDKSADTIPAASGEQILTIQNIVKKVYITPRVVQYITRLIANTRKPDEILPPNRARLIQLGASPRGTLALTKAARVIALLRGRPHVIPEDIVAVAERVIAHRLSLTFEASALGVTAGELVTEIVENTPQP